MKQPKTTESLSNKADFSSLPKHYTEQEVADYLDVDIRIVKQLLDTEALAFFPIGKRRRVTEEALRNYMTRTKGTQPCQQTEAAQAHASAKTEVTSASEIETEPAPSASTRVKVGRPFASQTLRRAILRKRS